jgi:Fe2+ transport system protein FeoA
MSDVTSNPTALKLTDLPIGTRATVAYFDVSPEIRIRLGEMGVTRGVELQVVRHAPLGDPVELRVRGYNLSLRKRDAAGVYVNKL